jgi:hypothetical protein
MEGESIEILLNEEEFIPVDEAVEWWNVIEEEEV